MTGGPSYRIYPSLLNKFQSLLDADIEADAPWNMGEDGLPKLTAEEVAERLEGELLDAINRVPQPPSEAADRGTCFNEVVDRIIAGLPLDFTKTMRDGREMKAAFHTIYTKGAFPKAWEAVRAELGGFSFDFDPVLCEEAAERFGTEAVPQHLCRGLIETARGVVELYGYADEIAYDRVYDLKTTSSYTFGKYETGWQRFVYPYCLVQSGQMPSVRSFEYTVFPLSKPTRSNPLITGKIYPEEYTYDHAYATERLRGMCGLFADWLELHRDRITDTKIFGL